jgi:predicted metal-binding protein
MKEHPSLEIGEIEREFFVRGPIQVICQPKGFNRWCTLPYPDHPNGCPNFGKFKDCPPFAPYFLDIYKPELYVAFMRFNFEEYLQRKNEIHPDWTQRALRNPRHFQTHLGSKLRDFVNTKLTEPEFENFQAVHSPEAMGINMHLTVRNAGIELEWPPRKNMYRITLLAQALL